MISLKLPDDYKHFDKLIWQVPSWGIAIAAGVVVAAMKLEDKKELWGVPSQYIQSSILFFGVFLLSALSLAIHKYRLFQSACLHKPLPKPPFGKNPSASKYLQGSLLLTTGGLAGIAATPLYSFSGFIPIGVLIGIVAWVIFERRLKLLTDEMDKTELDK